MPLTTLLQKGSEFVWGEAQEHAFQRLKDALVTAPVLILPERSRDYTIKTDASGMAIGCILEQDHDRGLQPIPYFSHKLTPAETHYAVHERKMLATYCAVKRQRSYLDGKQVTVLTDHRALQYIRTQRNLSPRQVR